ncbi:MAG: reductase [Ferruginibacter sp.]|uniref:dTDP-4-dehydrorhamnose reductase family protein n=1 Tax=Ferruginibacter sp. TaxID=1940288 RepID=UPI00265B1E17|nr:SDR family oxidoreductase [Ferruginibacter sp.]MDB5275541.1 reductase [Ferruginibacter sp.]
MKKIIVFGATGMAGHVVYHYLNELGSYTMYNTSYRNKLTTDSIICDVLKTEEVAQMLKMISPDYIINCIGALINESRASPDNAVYLNAFFPNYLVRIANEIGSKLIHISTDCVFNGKKGAYGEDSFRDADDVYGRSKALGEINGERHLTLRTSIIGPELKPRGEGLFDWFMHQSSEVNGYTDAFWSGISTLELAKSIEKALNYNLSGLLHVTNGVKISKYELLQLLNLNFKNDSVTIKPTDKYRVDKSLTKSKVFEFEVPGYNCMLQELKEWINQHNLYKYNR